MKLLESPRIRAAAWQRRPVLGIDEFHIPEKSKTAIMYTSHHISSLVLAIEPLVEWLVVPDGATITLSRSAFSQTRTHKIPPVQLIASLTLQMALQMLCK
jgi:hypothetical protein